MAESESEVRPGLTSEPGAAPLATATVPAAAGSPRAGGAGGEGVAGGRGGAGGPLGSLVVAAGDIKLAHSIFALPFAILGAFLARPADEAWPRFAAQAAIVVACMVCARTWAMLINRLVDRDIDAENVRTRGRAVASGRLSVTTGWVLAGLAAAAFVGATALFQVFFGNWWPLWLSVPVLAWIAFYSFTKRFTALCHLFLGGALGISPVAAAIAVRPEAVLHTPALWWLAAFVVLWVAGFDVIYALQDMEFDQRRGLFSIPAALGERGAIWAARALHAVAFVVLLAAWTSHAKLAWLFASGMGVVAFVLIMEHVIVARRGRAGIPMAFFTLNGVVSCVLGVAGCVDLL